jgi:hypothetical protein
MDLLTLVIKNFTYRLERSTSGSIPRFVLSRATTEGSFFYPNEHLYKKEPTNIFSHLPNELIFLIFQHMCVSQEKNILLLNHFYHQKYIKYFCKLKHMKIYLFVMTKRKYIENIYQFILTIDLYSCVYYKDLIIEKETLTTIRKIINNIIDLHRNLKNGHMGERLIVGKFKRSIKYVKVPRNITKINRGVELSTIIINNKSFILRYYDGYLKEVQYDIIYRFNFQSLKRFVDIHRGVFRNSFGGKKKTSLILMIKSTF